MKLYLTLEDDEGQKVERVYQDPGVTFHGGSGGYRDFNDVVIDMKESLRESKKPL